MPRLAIVALTCLAALAIVATPARADAQVPLDISVSAKGGPNFSGMTEPTSKTLNGVGVLYPGFFGVGGGLGLFIEPRIFDIVGIEFGFIWETSSGSGDFNDLEVEYTTTDMVFPLMVKASTPGSTHGTFGIGGEFIVPLGNEVTQDDRLGTQFSAVDRDVKSYFAFSAGIEIDAVYVKIPIELRARWAPGISDDLEDRVESASSANYVLKPNQEWQGMVVIGVGYDIPILE